MPVTPVPDPYILEATRRVIGTITIGGQPIQIVIPGEVEVTQDTPANLNATVVVPGEVEVVQDTHDDLNANANLQKSDVDVGPTNPVDIVDTFEIVTIADIAPNESDKVFTLAAGFVHYILWIYVEYTSDVAAAVRQLQIDFRDTNNNVVGSIVPGVTQAASLTYRYMIGPSLADHLGVRDGDYIMTPMPSTVFLPAGYDIHFFDNNLVSPLGDTMIIRFQVARRAA